MTRRAVSYQTGWNQLLTMVNKGLASSQPPLVVLVAGGTASGKTKLSTRLARSFRGQAVLISMDDYCRGASWRQRQQLRGRRLSWDHPSLYDLGRLSGHIKRLVAGQTVEGPRFDLASLEPSRRQVLDPRPLVIVEGLFVLRPTIGRLGDIKIFVDSDEASRLARRLLRDRQRTGQNASQIIDYFFRAVRPLHQRYVEPTKDQADLTLTDPYSPGAGHQSRG